MSSYFWFVSIVGDEEGRRVDSDEEGGGLVVSILSHRSFVTTVSGVVKGVQKQTFPPCQPAVVIASEKTGNVRCCSR